MRQSPPLGSDSVGVFERGRCLQGVLGRAGQDQLFVIQLELRDRNGDVVLGDRQETAGMDDGVIDRLVWRVADVLDRTQTLFC